jgi:hypothetical protein
VTTTLSPSDQVCDVCGKPQRCLLVAVSDDPSDLSRSALTLRTMVAPVCRRCIDRTFTPPTYARSRWDEQEKPES